MAATSKKKPIAKTIHRAAFPYKHFDPVKAVVFEVTNHYHDVIRALPHERRIQRDSKDTGILSDGTRVYCESGKWIYVKRGGKR